MKKLFRLLVMLIMFGCSTLNINHGIQRTDIKSEEKLDYVPLYVYSYKEDFGIKNLIYLATHLAYTNKKYGTNIRVVSYKFDKKYIDHFNVNKHVDKVRKDSEKKFGLHLFFVKDIFGEKKAGYNLHHYEDCREFIVLEHDQKSKGMFLTHEVGHAFELEHNMYKNNIMNKAIGYYHTRITERQKEIVLYFYKEFLDNCTGI